MTARLDYCYWTRKVEELGEMEKTLKRLSAEANKMANEANFIRGFNSILNMTKTSLVEELQRRGFDSDPVKKWKKSKELEDDRLS
jgi:hypothetical protein